MDEQKVFVKDGVGYIYFYVCKAIQRLEFISVIFDNLVTGWRYSDKYGSFDQGELINKAARRFKLLNDNNLQLSVFLKTEV